MKIFKAAIMASIMFALALWSVAGSAAADPQALETNLAWAQMMVEGSPNAATDPAWGSHWRNEAGRFASELALTQLEKKSETPVPPAAPPDPNARFRAAVTPEENLARVPAPKVTTESDYIPKLRPGEMAGVTVDYARIESMISRPPAEPTSTATVIPPLMGYGWDSPGWGGGLGGGWGGGWIGGWGGWGGRRGGWGGWGGGRGGWAPPCVMAPPVYYDPYCRGGVSGGFFYRSRNFGIGVGF
ncbi:MAG: hypothetical protein WC740_13605 [Verrucomicrobiia bacterium]